jgi:hypothetical protein
MLKVEGMEGRNRSYIRREVNSKAIGPKAQYLQGIKLSKSVRRYWTKESYSRYRSVCTRLLSGVHVTPTQDAQTGVVELQLSFLPWGSEAANARRACLSELRSALFA